MGEVLIDRRKFFRGMFQAFGMETPWENSASWATLERYLFSTGAVHWSIHFAAGI